MTPIGPSAHLSWSELACHDAATTPYPEKWRTTRAVTLATEFERIRATVGKPLWINSGYRTEAHNRAIGGSLNSQHVEGRALDLVPPTNWTPRRLYEAIRLLMKTDAGNIRGLGIYPTFVHFDVRPNERLVVWHGSRAWEEAV